MGIARGTIVSHLNILFSQPSDLDAIAVLKFLRTYKREFTHGSGNDKITSIYFKRHTIAASSSVTLDLNGSATFLDIYGVQINFTKIRDVWLACPLANPHDVVVGGAAANAWQGPFNATTMKMNIAPDGHQHWVHPKAGWTVTPATADQFLMANAGAGGSVAIDVCMLGEG
jgi:hypothetical protein